MKKINWSILFFILLAVSLSISLSYLGFNQKVGKSDKKTETTKETAKMTIAIVNEDQGSTFNDKQINFGENFVKSIEKDTSHEWFIVSRGVAESGLKRDIYNMEIIIPNDFSKKALSLTSKNPEKITVNYKINDVGNEDLKTEAEKTASTILEDMNKRVIDVYFASILTNLQEAQDNIKSVVEKEREYNNNYQTQVNAPISSYTKEFKTVQDYSGTSKDNFKSFQTMLTEYQKTLGEGKVATSNYDKELQSVAKLQVQNLPASTLFTKNLDTFNNYLSADSIMKETASLTEANEYLHTEFQVLSNNNSLLTQTKALQTYITNTNSKITELDNQLLAILNSNLKEAVSSDLKRILQGTGETTKSYYLKELTEEDINGGFKNKLASLIQKIPTFEKAELEDLGLNNSKYVNIIQLSKCFYNNNSRLFPDDFYPGSNATDIPVNDLLDRMKTTWKTGKEVKSKWVTIPKSDLPTTFHLTIENNFNLSKIKVVNEEKEEFNLSDVVDDGKKFKIEPQDKDVKIQIVATASLTNEDASVPLFGSLNWGAMYQQQEQVKIDADDEKSETEENSQAEDQSDQPADDESGEESTNEDTDNNDQSSDTTDEVEPIITEKPVVAISVDTPNFVENSKEVSTAYLKTIRYYEQLSVLYQLYYGLNPADEEAFPNLEDTSKNLDDIATSNSYAYIFNNVDVMNKLVSLSSDNFVQDYANRMQNFENRLKAYQSLMVDVDNKSTDLSSRLTKAVSEANSQNENLTKVLTELEEWRKKSLALVADNSTVTENADKEKEAVMQLNTDFTDLLARSESLAEGASSNSDSAEGVYKTFDAIDKKANSIQASGKKLINEAAGLSAKLSKKLKDDQTFQKNFSNVMDNSRVGERQNENLYDFLSRPVQKVNAGTIVAGDKVTPYYTVIIFILAALFTSYVIAYQEKRRAQQDVFLSEVSITLRNLPITFMTVGIAIAEGLTIGLITGKLFQIEKIGIFLWLGISVLIMLTLVTVFTYLLRQLQMFGMFVVLITISCYLFLTDAVGMNVDNASIFARIKAISPLQQVEQLLIYVFNGEADFAKIIYMMVGITAIFTTLNLFVFRKGQQREERIELDEV